jgi:hypothetical protein
MYLFCNSRIHVITLYLGHVCVYYAPMLRCWQLVWILIRTDHPCLGVGCHKEFDPNEFSNLIHEYTYIIKREKGKIKKLESAHDSFESSHNDLLTKYNALLKEHDESLVLSKQVSDQYDKLKFEHVELRQKYNYLELAYEALEDNLEQAYKIKSTKIVKVDASTSCDDLPNELVYATIEKSATNPSLENASYSTKGKKE